MKAREYKLLRQAVEDGLNGGLRSFRDQSSNTPFVNALDEHHDDLVDTCLKCVLYAIDDTFVFDQDEFDGSGL